MEWQPWEWLFSRKSDEDPSLHTINEFHVWRLQNKYFSNNEMLFVKTKSLVWHGLVETCKGNILEKTKYFLWRDNRCKDEFMIINIALLGHWMLLLHATTIHGKVDKQKFYYTNKNKRLEVLYSSFGHWKDLTSYHYCCLCTIATMNNPHPFLGLHENSHLPIQIYHKTHLQKIYDPTIAKCANYEEVFSNTILFHGWANGDLECFGLMHNECY